MAAGKPVMPTDTNDGHSFGNSSTDKISFYGATPVVRPSAITALTTTPTTAELRAAVTSILAALTTLGLVAS